MATARLVTVLPSFFWKSFHMTFFKSNSGNPTFFVWVFLFNDVHLCFSSMFSVGGGGGFLPDEEDAMLIAQQRKTIDTQQQKIRELNARISEQEVT